MRRMLRTAHWLNTTTALHVISVRLCLSSNLFGYCWMALFKKTVSQWLRLHAQNILVFEIIPKERMR